MKLTSLLLLTALLAGLLFGCGHLDLKPQGEVDRVVTGTVNVRINLIPPPDAELVVRIVEPPNLTASPTAANDVVIGQRGMRSEPERVVAQQVMRPPSAMPMPFRLELRATDAQLRHGLNIEARLSWGGRVRFRNPESLLVSSTPADQPLQIWLEAVE